MTAKSFRKAPRFTTVTFLGVALVISVAWSLQRTVAEPPQLPPPGGVYKPPTPEEEAERVRKIVEHTRNVGEGPIDFYGRIVDQNGRGIEGVQVVVSISLVWSDPLKFAVSTDANGTFEITGKRGEYVSVESVEKKGYLALPAQAMWCQSASADSTWQDELGHHPFARISGPSYSRRGHLGHKENEWVPGKDKPVIIRMWKVGTPVPLIKDNIGTRIKTDGSWHTLTLNNKGWIRGSRKSVDIPGPADLRFRIEQESERDANKQFSWSFAIEPVDGGILETTDDFLRLAPAEGYQPSFSRRMAVPSPNGEWHGELHKRFFARLRNGGMYAALEIEVSPNGNGDAALHMNYIANPKGSPSLEYDENLQIDPHGD